MLPGGGFNATGQTHLMLGTQEIANGEDYFPFRAQWISADEFLYPADGKIKRRSLATGRADDDRVHRHAARDAGVATRASGATSIRRRPSR